MTAGAAKPDPHSPRRFGEAAGLRRLPCGTRTHGLVANSLRELRSLRSVCSVSGDEIGSRGALRALAMGAAFLGASQAHRSLSGPGFAEALDLFATRETCA